MIQTFLAVDRCETTETGGNVHNMNTTVEKKRPPPVKVLSGQLRTAETRRTADSGDGCVIKLGRGRYLQVSLVWMQGTVLEVQLDRNTVLLMDETGTFAVQGVNNIPRGKPCLCPGKDGF